MFKNFLIAVAVVGFATPSLAESNEAAARKEAREKMAATLNTMFEPARVSLMNRGILVPRVTADDHESTDRPNTLSPYRVQPFSAPPPIIAQQISVDPGQPLCIDKDSLLTILMAAVLKGPEAAASVGGCEAIAPGSKAELIERYPSGSPLGRVVKVKVTSPKNPGAITGYTIELNK